MAAEVLVDALPYIDQGYDDPGVREAALAMVEEECRRYRPTKNYLEHLPTLNMTAFETDMMNNEFERIQNRVPMEPLSMKRYELPPPPPGKISELSAWQESVENSMAQLEHQAVRALNLELMLEYGCEAWKAHLEIFTSLQAKAQLRLAEIKKDIQETNWQRKSKQTQAGEKLKSLEAQWVLLVSKNYEIEQACAKLEETISQYRSIEFEHQLQQPSPFEADTDKQEDDDDGRQAQRDAQEEADQHDEDAEPNEEQSTTSSSESPKTDDSNSQAEQPVQRNSEDDIEMKDVSNENEAVVEATGLQDETSNELTANTQAMVE